jgi:ribonuclease D
VTALAADSKLPVENLLSPDALRRLSWDPPQVPDEQAVAQALAGYGARPWQIELTAGPVAHALTNPKAAASDADVADLSDAAPGDASPEDASPEDASSGDV